MKLSVPGFLGAALLVVVLLLSGCLPTARGQSEEEKEPNYLAGKRRAKALDYRGAIEYFEKALSANPKSAAAHFELGYVHYELKDDPAAVIYHFEQYLRLRPNAENASLVRQQILGCKQDLAKTVSLGPVTREQQRNLDKLAEENKILTEANQKLADEVMKWRAYFAARGVETGSENGERTTTRMVPTARTVPEAMSTSRQAPTETAPRGSSSGSAAVTRSTRTHRVRSGETLFSISRQYGVSVEALTRANRSIDPRRLRPGYELKIP